MLTNMTRIRHPRAAVLRLAAVMIATAWIGVATMFASIAAGAVMPDLRVRSVFFAGWWMMIVGGVAGLALGTLARCTECAAPLFDQSSRARHRSIRRVPLL